MSFPNALVVASWRPDSSARFFADGLQLAGARVVRIGPRFFDGYDASECPPVHDLGLWVASLGSDLQTAAQKPFAWRFVLSLLAERGFRPNLVVRTPFADLATDKLPANVSVIEVPSELEPLYDPNVHVNRRDLNGAIGQEVTDDPDLAGLGVHLLPSIGILARVAALSHAEVYHAPLRTLDRRAAEAHMCGAAVQVNRQTVPWIEEPKTYQRRAIELLTANGFDTSLPKLWA